MSERAKPPRRVGHSKSDELVFMALGGLGEIGMNVYLYGFGPANARSWLMVDLGVTFPNDPNPAPMSCCRISGSSSPTGRISSAWF